MNLLKQLLKIAKEEDLIKIHHLSLDGTKVKAKTSLKNITNEQQLKIMKEHLEESIKLDQEEDLELGDESGNSVPELACPPGVSLIALSPRALARVAAHPSKCMYLDLRSALANGDRGQTPFTPAVGVLLQINQRLREIEERGGVEAEIATSN